MLDNGDIVHKQKLEALIVLAAILFSAVSAFALETSTVPPSPVGKGTVVPKATRQKDGTGKQEIQNAVVFGTDNIITVARTPEKVQIPADEKFNNLGDATLMPGFIDAHTHVIGRILRDANNPMAVVKDCD